MIRGCYPCVQTHSVASRFDNAQLNITALSMGQFVCGRENCVLPRGDNSGQEYSKRNSFPYYVQPCRYQLHIGWLLSQWKTTIGYRFPGGVNRVDQWLKPLLHLLSLFATKVSRVQSLASSLRIFASGNRVGQCRWSAGFSGMSRFPRSLHSCAASISPYFILIGSEDFDVKCRPNLFTHLTSYKIDTNNAVKRAVYGRLRKFVRRTGWKKGGIKAGKKLKYSQRNLLPKLVIVTLFHTPVVENTVAWDFIRVVSVYALGKSLDRFFYLGIKMPPTSWESIRLDTAARQLKQAGRKRFAVRVHAESRHLNAYIIMWAAVSESLACSLSTKANRVQSPAGSLPYFRKWESWWTMLIISGDLVQKEFSERDIDACSLGARTLLMYSRLFVPHLEKRNCLGPTVFVYNAHKDSARFRCRDTVPRTLGSSREMGIDARRALGQERKSRGAAMLLRLPAAILDANDLMPLT
ncbi:hypothetical protein PR048_025398 [Dryococelus australis]|uniref:Uncharacterized protein n=1 Tax=Dryococelus australis TaxID=614101 RepID=A0ABQ9GRA6_9NEOP|nr:hypothetical protein PR048_025398 [Dryococelus australis]